MCTHHISEPRRRGLDHFRFDVRDLKSCRLFLKELRELDRVHTVFRRVDQFRFDVRELKSCRLFLKELRELDRVATYCISKGIPLQIWCARVEELKYIP